jgi:phosphatidylserine decarboxylase
MPAAVKREQLRQARAIHGGRMRLYLAHLAVKLSRLTIPSRRLRLRLFRDLYTRMYPPGLNEEEAENPLAAYCSFNAVFTRGVKPEYRPIATGSQEIASPCDGTIQDAGRVERGRLMTIKGVEYLLESLVPEINLPAYEGGQFAIIFLSPVDCHRVFSPQHGHLEEVVSVPGARLLVHPPFQRAEYPVYTLNERVVFRLASDAGSYIVVMVAGWGVGNITLPFAPHFHPNSRQMTSWRPELPRTVKRGEWIATFELGSAVVLIMSSSLQAAPLVFPGEKVQYGQSIVRSGSDRNSPS